jgi:peroxiredoxin
VAVVGRGGAQEEPAQPKPKVLSPAAAGQSIQTINDEYNRQLLQLERQRLDRLGQLAAGQAPKDAAETYEMLFRLAIANNLFAEAEPAAERVLKSAGPAPVVRFLAETINLIAAADRGAYDESLADLRRLIGGEPEHARPAEAATAVLDTPSLLMICTAYYQRLVQGDRFDVARKAFQLVGAETRNPAVKEFCAGRLGQLDLVGKPAPPIQGTDLDGKPVGLAALKGDVVLVVFWASWCLPSAAEIAWLDQVYEAQRHRGFRILGINVDTLQSGAPRLEAVLPNIRRFLVEQNVRWPNLINGPGPQDYARAFGVTEIPTNFLIGRDGTVVHLDLSRKNLARVVAQAVAQR